MRKSEIEACEYKGNVQLSDWCFQGRSPDVACYWNRDADVAYQLWPEGGQYRHTEVLNGQVKKYGDWIHLTPE